MESDSSGHSYEEGATNSSCDDESDDTGSDDNTTAPVSENSDQSERDVSSNYGPRCFHDDVRELFGGSYYTYRIERAKLNRVPAIRYRDAGWVVGNEVGKCGFADETIISGFLAKLSFECLNKISWSTGESILHIAVNYDRAGQNLLQSSGRSKIENVPEKNIVKWLLNNPDFVHAGTLTKGGGGTVFHSALEAHIPETMIFINETYGPDGPDYAERLGCDFVAHGALQTLLDDETSKRLINVKDGYGRSPLEFAMIKGASRNKELPNMRAGNGQHILTRLDTSLTHFFNDYLTAMLGLLDNRYLRLHGLFGVTESCVSYEKARMSVPPSNLSKTLRFHSTRPERYRGLLVLRNLCATDHGDPVSYAPAVEKILSENAGNLNDETKATILATCVGKPCDSSAAQWYFDPRKVGSKEVGAVLRKFYVRHSRPALKALESSLAELHSEQSDILLLPIRSKLIQKFLIDPFIFRYILSFAGRNNAFAEQIETLATKVSVLNNDVAGFFLGGIESCLRRKYGIGPDIWKRLLEYSGLRRELFPVDLSIENSDWRLRSFTVQRNP